MRLPPVISRCADGMPYEDTARYRRRNGDIAGWLLIVCSIVGAVLALWGALSP